MTELIKLHTIEDLNKISDNCNDFIYLIQCDGHISRNPFAIHLKYNIVGFFDFDWYNSSACEQLFSQNMDNDNKLFATDYNTIKTGMNSLKPVEWYITKSVYNALPL